MAKINSYIRINTMKLIKIKSIEQSVKLLIAIAHDAIGNLENGSTCQKEQKSQKVKICQKEE